MTETFGSLLVWAPRLLGIAVCLFLGTFALDAFGETRSLRASLSDFMIHLVPSLALLALVAIAWRRPWVGAAAFLSLGLAYAFMAQRVDWILVISGPLCVVGLLFLWSWWHSDALQRTA